MAKIVEAVKKAVTKKPVVKEEKKPVTCQVCNGSGLLNRETLCMECTGSGQV